MEKFLFLHQSKRNVTKADWSKGPLVKHFYYGHHAPCPFKVIECKIQSLIKHFCTFVHTSWHFQTYVADDGTMSLHVVGER